MITLLRRRDALLLGGALAAFLALMVGLPLASVLLSSVARTWSMTPLPTAYTLRWFDAIRAADLAALLTSLGVATGVGVFAAAFGTYAAYVVQRGRVPLSRLFDTLLMYTIALPSVVIGLAVLVAFHRPPAVLTESFAGVLLAQVLIVLPFVFRTVSAVLHGIDPRLEEAAVGLGASEAGAFFRVVLPLVLPGMLSGFVLAFCLSIGELGATLMVYPPGFSTVTLAIYALALRGFYYQAAALSVVMLAVSFAALLLLSQLRTRMRWATWL